MITETLTMTFSNELAFLPKELIVITVSALPVIELRGALPLALQGFEFSQLKSLILVLIGNSLPAFFILYSWDFVKKQICKWFPKIGYIFDKIEQKTKGRSQAKIQKYGYYALVFFVAIPLPGSGVWTGALIAQLFSIPKSQSFRAIFLGMFIAALSVLFLTEFIAYLFQ